MHFLKYKAVVIGALFFLLNFCVTPKDCGFVSAESYSDISPERQVHASPSYHLKNKKSKSSRKTGEVLATDSVEVKQSGKNSLIAKEKALAIAARRAFSSLLRDHAEDLTETDAASIEGSKFSDREINNCIYDYSIENEKHSESIYICAVRYRFDTKRIVSLFQKHGIKCRADDSDNSNIKVAIYTRDFIKNNAKIYTKNCVVQTYSSEYVVLFIRNCTKKEFEELGLRYALL